jgi:hypothetical protein
MKEVSFCDDLQEFLTAYLEAIEKDYRQCVDILLLSNKQRD